MHRHLNRPFEGTDIVTEWLEYRAHRVGRIVLLSVLWSDLISVVRRNIARTLLYGCGIFLCVLSVWVLDQCWQNAIPVIQWKPCSENATSAWAKCVWEFWPSFAVQHCLAGRLPASVHTPQRRHHAMPYSHRRRNKTVEFRRVNVISVHWVGATVSATTSTMWIYIKTLECADEMTGEKRKTAITCKCVKHRRQQQFSLRCHYFQRTSTFHNLWQPICLLSFTRHQSIYNRTSFVVFQVTEWTILPLVTLSLLAAIVKDAMSEDSMCV